MGTKLTGKVALITGASSGIGAATAKSFLEEGTRVVAAARRVDRLRDFAQRLAVGDDRFLAIEADVSDDASAEGLIRSTLEWGGKLDMLINNAGLSRGSLHEGSAPDDLHMMLDTNVFGLVNLTRLALPTLKQSKGDIVNISSTAAKVMMPGSALYSATKGAVATFSEALRKEVGIHGVRVITIYPGFVDTEFFDYFDEAKKRSIAQLRATMDPLQSEDLAALITFCVTQPPHVSLNEIVIRPTKHVV